MHQTAPLAPDALVFNWDWHLAASPEALWPLVSDTNRINVLASMAPADFKETPHPDGGAERTGHAKQLGMSVSWDEHPFEWSYPQGFSVMREFHNGVLAAYRSSVVLSPEGTGTHLHHMVELIPRLALMAPFVRREGPKQFRNWDHAYRAIDAYLAGQGPYPFEPLRKVKLKGESQALAREIEVASPDPLLERRLFDYVLGAPDMELVHLRPFTLADRWRVERDALLSVCQSGVGRGLLVPQWSLLCPHCRGAKGTASSPSALGQSVHCNACNIDYGRATDSVIELTFRPDPRYRKVQEATYCVGGPGATPHVVYQGRMAGGAGRDLSLSVAPGSYRLRGPRLPGHLDFTYHGAVAAQAATLEEALEAPAARPVMTLGAEGLSAESTHLEGEQLMLTLVNSDTTSQDVVVETRTWRDDAVTLNYVREALGRLPELQALLGAAS